MLRLESKGLKLCVALLVSNLALVVFLFLQLEYLLEWRFGHGRRDIVLAVEVLHDHASVSNPSTECSFLISFSTYHFAQQEHVLAAHEEDSTWDVGVKLSGINSFDSILENKVR